MLWPERCIAECTVTEVIDSSNLHNHTEIRVADRMESHTDETSVNEFHRVIIKPKKRKSEDELNSPTMKTKSYKTKTGQASCSNRFDILKDKEAMDEESEEDEFKSDSEAGEENQNNGKTTEKHSK
ncbi:hypothetical protein PUN28_019169 [Cardiocondyla obscurior]|uniref:Uncharacterized protein n=1 Tax=Cardiocondyla obscurior TaxID=286306 RepID=A0AAW2EI47_9HYME